MDVQTIVSKIAHRLPATRYKHKAVRALIETIPEHGLSERALKSRTIKIIKSHFKLKEKYSKVLSTNIPPGEPASPKNVQRSSTASSSAESSVSSDSRPADDYHRAQPAPSKTTKKKATTDRTLASDDAVQASTSKATKKQATTDHASSDDAAI